MDLLQALHSIRWPPVGFLESIVEIIDDGHVVAMVKKG